MGYHGLKGRIWTVTALLAAALSSCGTTRNLAEDEYVLSRNRIVTDRTVHPKDRIDKSEISRYIKQKPVSNILGIRTWVYSQADPESQRWWDRTLRKLGTEYTILDTVQTRQSAENIKRYLDSRGFFLSEESFAVEADSVRRRSSVTYLTAQNAPYTVSRIEYMYRDDAIAEVLEQAGSEPAINVGDRLDNELMNAERSRISAALRHVGYYDFSIDNVRFAVDTTYGDRKADVRVLITGPGSGTGEGMPGRHRKYRIRSVSIMPSFDAATAMSDAEWLSGMDTLSYGGLDIIYRGELAVKPQVLRDMVMFSTGDLYDEDLVSRTYSNLVGLDCFTSSSIVFTRDTTGTAGRMALRDRRSDSSSPPEDGGLICEIRCTPSLRQSFSLETEASATSSFYSLTGQIGYQNRNLLRGAELFELRFRAGYELLKTKSSRDSYEIGGDASLTFPKFLLPIPASLGERIHSPKTTMSLEMRMNSRPYYERVLSSATFAYSWHNGRNSTYSVKPLDLNLIKLNRISDEFLERLNNPYLRNSYSSQFIGGISGSFVMNRHYGDGGSFVIRANAETMGNTLYGLYSLFSPDSGGDPYRIFGIQFAEYVRADMSLVRTMMLGGSTSLAARLYGGFGHTYGNSRNSSIPFDRLFYSGGINSMRGWMVRTLGPGNSPESQETVYPSQLGNIRLEANMELRFPMWKSLNGALFLDTGNVWYSRSSAPDDLSAFGWGTFMRQLGLNTGLGLRLDFKVTIIRLDWGIQLHNPNLPEGERWLRNVTSHSSALNFGIGYPF